jgi:hypothetical protein
MLAIDGGTGILQLLEVLRDLIQTDPPNIRHGSSSVGRRKGYVRTDNASLSSEG